MSVDSKCKAVLHDDDFASLQDEVVAGGGQKTLNEIQTRLERVRSFGGAYEYVDISIELKALKNQAKSDESYVESKKVLV